MTSEDISAVMQGELASYPHPWSQKNFEDCMKNQVYSCWVFEHDKKNSGHVVISAAAGEAHILNICVYPEKQKQGWGRKLLEESEWIAKQHRAEMCFLEVRPSNKAGISLYESSGYNEIAIRKGYYPSETGREDALIMAKALIDFE